MFTDVPGNLSDSDLTCLAQSLSHICPYHLGIQYMGFSYPEVKAIFKGPITREAAAFFTIKKWESKQRQPVTVGALKTTLNMKEYHESRHFGQDYQKLSKTLEGMTDEGKL